MMDLIVDGLYIETNTVLAGSPMLLKEAGVDYVLDLSSVTKITNDKSLGIKYMHIPFNDDDLSLTYNATNLIISRVIRGGKKILVCIDDSESESIVFSIAAFYLATTNKFSFSHEILSFITNQVTTEVRLSSKHHDQLTDFCINKWLIRLGAWV